MPNLTHLQGSWSREVRRFRSLNVGSMRKKKDRDHLEMSILATDFPHGSVVKNPPAVQETWVQPLGWEDPLENEMATHCSILAC